MDNATLWYYDSTVWAPLIDLVKTPTTCTPQGFWTAYSISLPVSADNNPGIKIGFRWVNNDDNVGTDPSFAVDDITLGIGLTQITENNDTQTEINISFNPADYHILIENHKLTKNDIISIYSIQGQLLLQQQIIQEKTKLDISRLSKGVYIIKYFSSDKTKVIKFVKE